MQSPAKNTCDLFRFADIFRMRQASRLHAPFLAYIFLLIPAVIIPGLIDAESPERDEGPASYDTFMTEPEPVYVAEADTTEPANNPQRTLNGFADTAWMADYEATKRRFTELSQSTTTTERVEIMMAVRNRYLLIKRNDITYRYNFYKTPYPVAKLQNHQLSKEEHDQRPALLYQVKVMIPFIDSQMINDKLTRNYGRRTKSTVDEKTKRGVDIWEKEGGFIFQWYEPYKEKPYTRTIDYLSKEMSARIMNEFEDYFDASEKELLRKLIVN